MSIIQRLFETDNELKNIIGKRYHPKKRDLQLISIRKILEMQALYTEIFFLLNFRPKIKIAKNAHIEIIVFVIPPELTRSHSIHVLFKTLSKYLSEKSL